MTNRLKTMLAAVAGAPMTNRLKTMLAAVAGALTTPFNVTYANLNLTGSGGRLPKPKAGDGLDRIRKDIARSFVKKAHGRWNGWTHGPELSWDIMQPRIALTDEGKPLPPRDHKAERRARKALWREGMKNGFH